MIDFLQIYVLWHPDSKLSEMYADKISSHFDCLGMERDGVQYRVPVRYRSEPWNTGTNPRAPRPIDLNKAKHNAIIYLHDSFTSAEATVWDKYIGDIRADIDSRKNVDVFIPFQRNKTATILPSLAANHIHHAREDLWNATLPDDDMARVKRLILHILVSIREHFRALSGSTSKEPLFVSHAKADGDYTAKVIIDHVNSSDNDVAINTFYDAMELMPGQNFQKVFEKEISHGTLLAIVSDIYDSRPWCIYELTMAKRALRPIILADVGKIKTSRTYPYGANVPRIRLLATDPMSIEALLVEALSEGLRCDLFQQEASILLENSGIKDGLALPRPPELFDLIVRDTVGSVVVYPDPPIGVVEQEIIDKALKLLTPSPLVKTLGELR